MKIHKVSLHSRDQWLESPFSSSFYHSWLIERGSLTARLQKRYRDFLLQSLVIRYAKPSREEVNILRMRAGDVALNREVVLYGNGQPVVFAHSVLPRNSLRSAWRGLGKLGNRPLGATLFANHKVKRTPLSYKKLSANHALYRHAAKHLKHKPTYLWARRSVFSLNCANIMVTEVFLPNLAP
ncbi:MAG: chorismate--pyruvate lyase [Betaproteobacteria bacterium HGW-Betaproteobacteria-22]|nr:MAG: chorismate--pyruvate lyase [Betaproteobacteria bacterium HGW-Betaproteobacteria-22]